MNKPLLKNKHLFLSFGFLTDPAVASGSSIPASLPTQPWRPAEDFLELGVL